MFDWFGQEVRNRQYFVHMEQTMDFRDTFHTVSHPHLQTAKASIH